MQMRRRLQVLAARDQRHPLHRVVVRDAKMIAGRRVLARQHDVAEQRRIADDTAFAFLLERQRQRDRVQRPRHVQPQREPVAARRLARRMPPEAIRGRCRDTARCRPACAARWLIRRFPPKSPSACRSTDTAARAPPARPAPRDIPPDVATARAPGRPSRGRATPGPPRSPRRIPGGSGRDRCPRCAAGNGRRPRARAATRPARRTRGRDAG